jgi:hypothetical protein
MQGDGSLGADNANGITRRDEQPRPRAPSSDAVHRQLDKPESLSNYRAKLAEVEAATAASMAIWVNNGLTGAICFQHSRAGVDWTGSRAIIWQAIGPRPELAWPLLRDEKHEWPSLLGTRMLSMRHAHQIRLWHPISRIDCPGGSPSGYRIQR